jgi:hypothetical protein
MIPNSFDSVEKILQYIAVAVNALYDVAAATQIPFLESFCTFSQSLKGADRNNSGRKKIKGRLELQYYSKRKGSLDISQKATTLIPF